LRQHRRPPPASDRLRIAIAILALGALPLTQPGVALAAEHFALLRLEERGQVTELNPATNVSYRDLDTYLRSRLDGKQILEVKVQETREGCRASILVRYAE